MCRLFPLQMSIKQPCGEAVSEPNALTACRSIAIRAGVTGTSSSDSIWERERESGREREGGGAEIEREGERERGGGWR